MKLFKVKFQTSNTSNIFYAFVIAGNETEAKKIVEEEIWSLAGITILSVAEEERNKIKSRQAEGIAVAKEKGVKFGRPSIEYPKEFIPTYRKWKEGSLKAVDAMRLLGLKKTTFYKLVKQYEENGEEK